MITVLGAEGFIGSHVVRRLAESGSEHFAPRRGEPLTGRDLGDIIYCIGMTADFRARPFETVDAHVCTLRDVLRDCSFESLLYLSSTRLYAGGKEPATEENALTIQPQDPDQLYNISKAMGESLALGSDKKVRVARLSNVFGADLNSPNFLSTIIRDSLRDGKVILRTSLDSSKDYVGIDDVVDGLLDIARNGRHALYNVASGTNVSNGELMEKIAGSTGCRVEIAEGAATVNFPLIDIGRMRSEFGFRPQNLLDKVCKLVEACRANDVGHHSHRPGKGSGKP